MGIPMNYKNLITEAGIHLFFLVDTDEEECQYLNPNTIEELIRFVTVNQVKSILCNITYPLAEDILIEPDMLNEYPKQIMKKLQKKIDSYNARILEKVDFKRPTNLLFYCMYEGQPFAVEMRDDWLTELNLQDPYDAVYDLTEEYEEALDDIKNTEYAQNKDIETKFTEYLMNDPDFQICTNINMRRFYMGRVFKKPGMREFEKYFKGTYHTDSRGEKHFEGMKLYNAVETAWILYKQKKKTEK